MCSLSVKLLVSRLHRGVCVCVCVLSVSYAPCEPTSSGSVCVCILSVKLLVSRLRRGVCVCVCALCQLSSL